jgi:hypothetical protein
MLVDYNKFIYGKELYLHLVAWVGEPPIDFIDDINCRQACRIKYPAATFNPAPDWSEHTSNSFSLFSMPNLPLIYPCTIDFCLSCALSHSCDN